MRGTARCCVLVLLSIGRCSALHWTPHHGSNRAAAANGLDKRLSRDGAAPLAARPLSARAPVLARSLRGGGGGPRGATRMAAATSAFELTDEDGGAGTHVVPVNAPAGAAGSADAVPSVLTPGLGSDPALPPGVPLVLLLGGDASDSDRETLVRLAARAAAHLDAPFARVSAESPGAAASAAALAAGGSPQVSIL